MSKDCLTLAEVKYSLIAGKKLEFNLEETGCLWKDVAAPYITRSGGYLARVNVDSLRVGDRRGMRFNLWVKAGSVYNLEFSAFNGPIEGQLCTGGLKVSGNFLLRGTILSIAQKMLAHPNKNLEIEVGLGENTLRVDIDDRRSLIWLINS